MDQHVTQKYILLKKEYRSKKGLSERLVKSLLSKEGWEMWRGGLIHILRYKSELYPTVIAKYQRLIMLLNIYHPDKIDELQYLCSVHHGMPDYFCYRQGEFKFVECKLQYESVSKRQKNAIPKLIDLGFCVELYRVVDKKTRVVLAEIDLKGRRRVIERQLRLKKKW